VEREVEHEPGGLGAEALAAPLADRDAERGPAVSVRDLEWPRGANRCTVAAVIDGELDALRLVVCV
jgi:hypothetical protein